MIFDIAWFQKYQKYILLFANTWLGRRFFCLHDDRSEVAKNKIIEMMPSFITWKEGQNYRTEFRTANKFANRLYFGLYPVWYCIHQWDMLIANALAPKLNLGFDTFLQYTYSFLDSFGKGISFNAMLRRESVNQTFTAIRNDTDATETSLAANDTLELRASATTNQYQRLSRCVLPFLSAGFNTVYLKMIDAKVSVYGSSKNNGLGSPDLILCGFAADNPAGQVDTTQYDNFLPLRYGSKTYSAYSTSAYNDIVVNGAGKTFINSLNDLTTYFALRTGFDFLNTAPTWSSNAHTYFGMYLAEETGTSKDPKLTITYNILETLTDLEYDFEDSFFPDVFIKGGTPSFPGQLIDPVIQSDEVFEGVYAMGLGPLLNLDEKSIVSYKAPYGGVLKAKIKFAQDVLGTGYISISKVSAIGTYPTDMQTILFTQLGFDWTDLTVVLDEGDTIYFEAGNIVQDEGLSLYIDNFNFYTTVINNNIIPDRLALLHYGFKYDDAGVDSSGYHQVFRGYSDNPKVDQKGRRLKIHFFDELEKISRFKLSGGNLYQDVRTDHYIWDILDQVYSDSFKTVASFDVAETWSTSTDDTTNARVGTAAQRLSSSGSTVTAVCDLPALVDVGETHKWDFYTMFLFVEDVSKIESLLLRLESTNGTDYFEIDLLAYYSLLTGEFGLKTGWNQMFIPVFDFINNVTVGNFNAAEVKRVSVIYKTYTGQTAYVILDELRAIQSSKYGIRLFDVGLQYIPVAWFASNTALYEIKVACEAEGARFYADESGILRFENRQNYNLDPAKKKAQYGFNFDNIVDIEYTGDPNEIINKVIVKLKPRKIVAEKEIWRYGFTPQIAPGDTLTVWAEFLDPVPVTLIGLVTPVATTDYTANTLEDGTGTNKTAQVSIAISKFANSAKLEITNNDAGAVYVTLLKLRGTPAEEQDESRIIVEDAASIRKYGVKPSGGYEIDNKYLADEDFAKTLAQQIIDWYKDLINRIILKNRAITALQLGDIISILNKRTGKFKIMRLIRSKSVLNRNGLNQELTSRAVLQFEQLNFFTIGTSEIEGPDVIAS